MKNVQNLSNMWQVVLQTSMLRYSVGLQVLVFGLKLHLLNYVCVHRKGFGLDSTKDRIFLLVNLWGKKIGFRVGRTGKNPLKMTSCGGLEPLRRHCVVVLEQDTFILA